MKQTLDGSNKRTFVKSGIARLSSILLLLALARYSRGESRQISYWNTDGVLCGPDVP